MNNKQLMDAAHPSYLGWQMDWPLYVKAPMVTMQGKVFNRGDYLPWAEMKVSPDKVALLYKTKAVLHDATKTEESGHGDRLGELSTKSLKSIVGLMNTKLRKDHCATETQFKQRKCRQSTIADTQRRFIRQFLAKNVYMQEYFLEIREPYLKKEV